MAVVFNSLIWPLVVSDVIAGTLMCSHEVIFQMTYQQGCIQIKDNYGLYIFSQYIVHRRFS